MQAIKQVQELHPFLHLYTESVLAASCTFKTHCSDSSSRVFKVMHPLMLRYGFSVGKSNKTTSLVCQGNGWEISDCLLPLIHLFWRDWRKQLLSPCALSQVGSMLRGSRTAVLLCPSTISASIEHCCFCCPCSHTACLHTYARPKNLVLNFCQYGC